MPLTNETALRTTLDALFFKENIEAKLKTIGIDELSDYLVQNDGEDEEAYLERAASWVGDHFTGYSIYHVDGRFPCVEEKEAKLVRYFFDRLFTKSIIQLINAEDEIWMVESGHEYRVHIWRVNAPDDDGSFDEDAEVEEAEDEA